MLKGSFNSVSTLIPYSVPIQQALTLDNDGKSTMFFSDEYGVRTQDFEKSYYDAGQFYWMTPDSVKTNRRISCDNAGAVILSELEAHDIDTEDDWQIAEYNGEYQNRVQPIFRKP